MLPKGAGSCWEQVPWESPSTQRSRAPPNRAVWGREGPWHRQHLHKVLGFKKKKKEQIFSLYGIIQNPSLRWGIQTIRKDSLGNTSPGSLYIVKYIFVQIKHTYVPIQDRAEKGRGPRQLWHITKMWIIQYSKQTATSSSKIPQYLHTINAW